MFCGLIQLLLKFKLWALVLPAGMDDDQLYPLLPTAYNVPESRWR